MTETVNISFYRFVRLSDLDDLQGFLRELCKRSGLKGTILLASEGINGMLAGTSEAVMQIEGFFERDLRFKEMPIKKSRSSGPSFKRLIVKIKNEIVTFREPGLDMDENAGSYINPTKLRGWLQAGEDFLLLDVRNQFEVEMGTFSGALNPGIPHFTSFKSYVRTRLREFKSRKIVTFCTGGIRCEKATAFMRAEGFQDVLQLEGGILEYLSRTDGAFWEGKCFVFDERIAVDKDLKPT